MAAKVHNIQLQSGTWFSAAGVEDQSATDSKAAPAIQAVLGEGVARRTGCRPHAEERAAARIPAGWTWAITSSWATRISSSPAS